MAITSANIESEFDNKLLKRREMLISLKFDGSTPSREEMSRVLADKFNLNRDNIVIVRTRQEFGTKEGSVVVHEYHDKEAMKIAQKHELARPNKKKGAAQAQQAAAPAPAEKPAEAQKEEEKK